MRIIVITHPDFLPNEHDALKLLFESGLELLHVRKPNSTVRELSKYLERIPSEYINRIVLHDHFELSEKFLVKGLHLNRRNNTVPKNFSGQLSCSCHSLKEVVENKNKYRYIFLSPIFNSISKQAHNAAFSIEQLKEAASNKIIDNEVIALGGIKPKVMPQLFEYGFGGCALLGYIWNDFFKTGNIELPKQHFLNCKN